MLLAVVFYRQIGDLLNRRFLDEIGFAILAIVVPILLMQLEMDTRWFLVPGLLGLFIIYRLTDRWVNRTSARDDTAEEAVGNLSFGIILGLSALIAISIAGIFLGDATAAVVEQMGIRPAIAGWILGVVTSIPEMVSFFAIYGAARREGTLRGLSDTQESLDNLTGSNMANVGVVYPFGLLAFLLSSAFLVS